MGLAILFSCPHIRKNIPILTILKCSFDSILTTCSIEGKSFFTTEHTSFKYEMVDTFIKWTALVITIAGAVCNAYLIAPLNIYLGNIGAVLYMTWAIRNKDWNIALVNFSLLMIYASGLIVNYL